MVLGHEHTDDGDFTMMYYPRLDWQKDWGGGTVVGGELVPYVGNRLIVFDAKTPHQCDKFLVNVMKKCHVLRHVEGQTLNDLTSTKIDFLKNLEQKTLNIVVGLCLTILSECQIY